MFTLFKKKSLYVKVLEFIKRHPYISIGVVASFLIKTVVLGVLVAVFF